MTLVKRLQAAGSNPALGQAVQSLLGEAAQALSHPVDDTQPDTLRLDALEDLGQFLLGKPDGCGYLLTVTRGKEKQVLRAETLRALLDELAVIEQEQEK
ncbi:hypothetical protein [Bergeriella denitrificans]|uniref:Uncharacterized protein n=1 Tax=Bergeriella denitrificans TaxID=494 RepID=A0A378UGQ6_BERDE|nr:hypothetical protein [Bergeriella denitrificans]STZ76310.1 Uncharacterised protein [Bergeriella denitrificans]